MAPGQPLGLPGDGQRGRRPAGRRHGDRRDQEDRQRGQGAVVRDEVTEDGERVEVTDDWYAQDADGNIWYSARTRPSTRTASRSRRAARSRPASTARRPGIVMPGRAEAASAYRQEYYKGEAEDEGEISSSMPRPKFLRSLAGRPDDPGHEPARAEGARVQVLRPRRRPVLAVCVSGGSGREELLSYWKG